MFGSSSLSTFTQTTASLQTTSHAVNAQPPASPTRPSRLRGLSYLRSYTDRHLHHHSVSPSSPPQSPNRPSLSRSNSTPTGRRQSRTTQAQAQAQTQTQTQRTPQSAVLQQVHRPSPSPQPQRNSYTPAEIPTSGWLPTVGGQSGLSRVAPQPQPTSTDSSTSSGPISMTRRRAATGTDDLTSFSRPDMTAAPSAAAPAAEPNVIATTTIPEPTTIASKKDMPTLRLIPHHEPRSNRPSLTFPIVTRTLPTHTTRVKVGRFSERDVGAADALTNPLSTAPVGFKSKVVSRQHCELWCESGQWYIKDVKSSSGTFLNHVRLSSPGMESRAYPVNDGDIVQLGIDFKGGEEQIFRCVKIRVECNRGWQKSLNQFNTATHKRILKSTQSGAAAKDSDAASTHSSECSICLCPVAPCQALFVAPCSHVWHYKCIRSVIYPSWPSFQCPNCRAYADLEADVDQPEEEEFEEEFEELEGVSGDDLQSTAANAAQDHSGDDEELTEMINSVSVRDSSPSPQPTTSESMASGSEAEADARAASSASSNPVPISTKAPVNDVVVPETSMAMSTTPTSTTQFALAAGMLHDGPTTPMNDAGPFLFDRGSAPQARPISGVQRESVTEEVEDPMV